MNPSNPNTNITYNPQFQNNNFVSQYNLQQQQSQINQQSLQNQQILAQLQLQQQQQQPQSYSNPSQSQPQSISHSQPLQISIPVPLSANVSLSNYQPSQPPQHLSLVSPATLQSMQQNVHFHTISPFFRFHSPPPLPYVHLPRPPFSFISQSESTSISPLPLPLPLPPTTSTSSDAPTISLPKKLHKIANNIIIDHSLSSEDNDDDKNEIYNHLIGNTTDNTLYLPTNIQQFHQPSQPQTISSFSDLNALAHNLQQNQANNNLLNLISNAHALSQQHMMSDAMQTTPSHFGPGSLSHHSTDNQATQINIPIEDDNKERMNAVLGQPPNSINVNVSANNKYGLRNYLVRARRILRLSKKCIICGIGNAVSVACEVVEVLKRERIAEILMIETSIVEDETIRPSLDVTLKRGKYAIFVSDFRRRKVIEIFEKYDSGLTGKLKIEILQLDKKFQADVYRTMQAQRFLDKRMMNAIKHQRKNYLLLPDFIHYCSILIHPLLLEYHFKMAIAELGGFVDVHDGHLPPEHPKDKLEKLQELGRIEPFLQTGHEIPFNPRDFKKWRNPYQSNDLGSNEWLSTSSEFQSIVYNSHKTQGVSSYGTYYPRQNNRQKNKNMQHLQMQQNQRLVNNNLLVNHNQNSYLMNRRYNPMIQSLQMQQQQQMQQQMNRNIINVPQIQNIQSLQAFHYGMQQRMHLQQQINSGFVDNQNIQNFANLNLQNFSVMPNNLSLNQFGNVLSIGMQSQAPSINFGTTTDASFAGLQMEMIENAALKPMVNVEDIQSQSLQPTNSDSQIEGNAMESENNFNIIEEQKDVVVDEKRKENVSELIANKLKTSEILELK